MTGPCQLCGFEECLCTDTSAELVYDNWADQEYEYQRELDKGEKKDEMVK